MLNVLIQADVYDPVLGATVSIAASSHDDPAVCHAVGSTWWPAIAKLPKLQYDLFDGAFGSEISSPATSLTLQTEPWPYFGRYAFADARFRLWTGDVSDPANVWTLRFDGRVTDQPQVEDGAAALSIAVDDRWLDAPLLATYAGTTGAEGPLAMKGQVKPLALGAPRYVPGTLIDSVNSVFQVSGYGAIREFEAALERAIRFGAPIADYPDYASLVAATIPPGAWATAKAVGMARFGAPTSGLVSFLIKGDVAGPDGWARKPGQLIRRIALIAGGAGRIDDASLNALDAACPYNLSYYVDQQTTARQLIQQIAASVNAVAGVSWLGKLFVVPVRINAPAITLAADGSALPPVASVQQIAVAPPFKKLAIGAERTWAVHALSDIAFSAQLLPLGAYNALTIYREGNIVDSADGSRFLYISATPGSGNAPPAATFPPAAPASNAYWKQIAPPTTAIWSSVTGAGKPADGASSDVRLTPIVGPSLVTIVGNSITNTVDSGYSSAVVAEPRYGASFVEMDINQNGWNLIALDNNATDFSYNNQEAYVEYHAPTGQFAVCYHNSYGTQANLPAGITGKIQVVTDRVNIYIIIGGVVRYSAAAPAELSGNAPVYPKFWAYSNSYAYTGLRCGPWTSNSWGDVAGAGKPANNATSDLQLTPIYSSSYVTILGNAITGPSSGSGYESGVVGQPVYGSCFVEASITPATYTMVGLDNDNTNYYYTAQEAMVHFNSTTGQSDLYLSGSYAGSVTVASSVHSGKKLTLVCDRVNVYVIVGGQVIQTAVAPASLTGTAAIYPKFWAYTPGATFTGLRAGAWTSNRWSDVAGAGRPADYAGTTVTFFDFQNAFTKTGNAFVKSASAAAGWGYVNLWTNEFAAGTAFVSGKMGPGSFMGLSYNGQNLDTFNQLEYAIHNVVGTTYAYESGNQTQDFGSGYQDALWAIVYDGVNVRWYANGNLMRTVSAAPALTMYAGFNAYNPGEGVSRIQFGPATDRAWSNIGGNGRPADNATSDGVFVPIGTAVVTGNTLRRSDGSTDYGAMAFSATPVSGPQTASIDINLTAWTMVALDNDVSTTATAYSDMLCAVHYRYDAGALNIYINGVGQYSQTIANRTGKLELSWDGKRFTVRVAGVWYWSSKLQTGIGSALLYGKFHAYNPGYTQTGLMHRADTLPTSSVTLYDARNEAGVSSIWEIRGGTAVYGSSSAWIGNAYSQESFTGTAALSARFTTLDSMMVGLSDGREYAGTADYSYGDYQIYNSAGSLYAYENGTGYSLGVSFTTSVTVAITYDGVFIRYYVNGIVKRTVSTTAARTFYACVSGATYNGTVSDIQFVAFSQNDWGSIGGAGRPEDNADVTLTSQFTVDMEKSIEISFDYTGTTASGVPKVLPVTVTRGGANVTTSNSASYSVGNFTGACTSSNITIDNTNGSSTKGRPTIVNGTAAPGSFDWILTYNGVQVWKNTVQVNKKLAAAPAGSGSGSSGYTKSGTFDAGGQGVGSTSYIAFGQVNNINVASGEALYGSFSGTYHASGGGNFVSRTMSGKFRWSAAGANSWNEFAPAVNGTTASYNNLSYDDNPGSITINQSASPGAGNYDVQLVLAENSSLNSSVLSLEAPAPGSVNAKV